MSDITGVDEDEIFGEIPGLEDPEFDELSPTETTPLIDLRELKGSERKSLPRLGKLAKSRLISARAKQLELGAPPAIPRSQLRSLDLVEIAKQELEARVLPIKIIRRFADGTYEVWLVREFKYIAGVKRR